MMQSLRRVVDEVERFRDTIREQPVTPKLTVPEVRQWLDQRRWFDEPHDLGELSSQITDTLIDGCCHVTHPRYFGLFNPGVHEASLVGEMLASGFNSQLASHTHAPAHTAIEAYTLEALADCFGLPKGGVHSFTSGGAEANLTGVLLALTSHFPAYREGGLTALPNRPCFYVSQEAHDSFVKIAQITGLGREALHSIPVGDDLKMDTTALQDQIAMDIQSGWQPFLVVGTAGTTSAGIIDPLADLANLCAQHNLWFHVDAAWGGAAAISSRLRPALDGIERADSITCDAHKWFSVNMGSGMIFCPHAQVVRDTFGTSAPYMPPGSEGVIDPYQVSVQWSRRAIGLKLFLTLAQHGLSGYARIIEHQAEMGDRLREKLIAAGWQIVNQTPFPTVCFTRPGLDSAGMDRLLKRLYAKREVWISKSILAGKLPALRATITHYDTQEEDLDWLVQSLTETLD